MRSRKTAKILLNSALESLEPRRLFSTSYTVTGTSSAEHIIVQMSGGFARWSINNGSSWTTAGDAVNGLTVNAGNGNDTIEIDSLTANSLVINGGYGSDNIHLDDVSGVSGTVRANGYEARPASGDWAGASIYDQDTLYAGNGDIHNFPNITFDSGSEQIYDAGSGETTITPGDFDPIIVDDHSDSNNSIWSVGETFDTSFNIDSGVATLQVGMSSRTITDVTGFVSAYPGGILVSGLSITSGSGNDTVTIDQDTVTAVGPDGVTFNSSAGADSITSNGGDNTVLNCGDGNDIVTLNALVGGVINGGTGNDLFNIQDIDDPASHRGVVTISSNGISGGDGNDTFVVGSRNHTLYGIGSVSLGGDAGTDTLTVDDSNYDSTDSYEYYYGSGSSNGVGARYKINSASINGAGFNNGGPFLVYAAQISFLSDVVHLKMQSDNNSGSAVHPDIEFGHDLGFYGGEFDLYPGDVPDPSSGYDYNILNINTTWTSSSSNTLHIKPSLGLDHVTVGGAGGSGHANVTFDGTVRSIGPLVINSGGLAAISVGAGNALKMSSLTIASGGLLDLTNSAAIIQNSTANNTTLLDTIRDWIIDGRGPGATYPDGVADGEWDGTTGIGSSTAAGDFINDSIESHVVGYGENDLMPLGAYSTFGGQSVGANDILLKYTINGDSDLDGWCGDNDVTIMNLYYDGADPTHGATSGHYLFSGDFNLDGYVDDADVTILNGFYQGPEM